MYDFTKEQLLRRAQRLQKMTERHYSRRKIYGEERFLKTDAGTVRVLCYGFENAGRQPLFVNIHGGGFALGNPEMDDPFMPRIAREADVKIISVDYGLSPQHPFPIPLEQCYAVCRHAQEHADELGIDAKRMAVGGHSAGGCLTAAVCLLNAERQELSIKAAILDYPVLDIYTEPWDKPQGRGFTARVFLSNKNSSFFSASYCFDRTERNNPLVSPVYASAEQLRTFPPTLIITCGKDTLCAEAVCFRDMLEKAGACVHHEHFAKSEHGFTLTDTPISREGWRLMIEHLRKWL